MQIDNWTNNIQFLLFPPRCLLCGDRGQANLDLCLDCERELPWLTHTCRRCARPLPFHAEICGACLRHPPPFHQTLALWCFQPPISSLVTAVKFQGLRPGMRLLGELLARHGRHWERPDCLVPVPLHPQRQRERGFNQALEIGRILQKRLRIPMRPQLCRRIRATPPQRTLNAEQRRVNLRGTFEATQPLQGLRLAVIDDVMTTGATAGEVASTLRKAGAERVDLWILARA